VRRLRNGRCVGSKRFQDLDAVPEHPVADATAHAAPDDRRHVRRRRRLDRRLLRLDAADAQRASGSPPRDALSDTSRDPAAVPATSAAPAAWVIEGVRDFDYTVGSVAPVGFQACTRVFHPAGRREGNGLVELRWADVARDYGRLMHPLAERGSLTGTWSSRDPARHRVGAEAPSTGKPPTRLVRGLAEVLAAHTQTREHCSFAVWEPNVWWPEDRAWCAASGIDLMSTYVGGSASCIAALLADDHLEALPASVDQLVTWDADIINPLPAAPGSGSV
jgi:hypothetical protein